MARRESDVLRLAQLHVVLETAEPEEVLGFLRAYHATMGALIVEHEGTLEHFAGDGFAFFNDPVLQPDHAARAIGLALAMRDRFASLSADWRRRGHVLELGIGIATGYATLGRIGSKDATTTGIGNAINHRVTAQRRSCRGRISSRRGPSPRPRQTRTSSLSQAATER